VVWTRDLLKSLVLTYKLVFKRHLLKLEERPALTEDQIWDRYYRDSGLRKKEVFVLWREIAAWLRVPADRMRPEDKLVRDLSPPGFLSFVDTVQLENLTEVSVERMQATGRNPDEISEIETVDDYVRAFALPVS